MVNCPQWYKFYCLSPMSFLRYSMSRLFMLNASKYSSVAYFLTEYEIHTEHIHVYFTVAKTELSMKKKPK